MKKLSFYLLSLLMVSVVFFACEDDEETGPKPIARFTPTVEETVPYFVSFQNDSENADTYSWDFGDGNTSTEENPTHTYAEKGDFTVTLTAKGKGGEAITSKDVTITGFTLTQFLTGSDASGKVWNLEFNELVQLVSATDRAWWYGWHQLGTAEQRNVVRHWDFIFKPDGTFEFDSKGETVRPGSGSFSTPFLFSDETSVYVEADGWIAQDGTDCSAWGDITNVPFKLSDAVTYAAYCDDRITLNKVGAHIGPMDSGTDKVVSAPADSTYYEIFHYADGGDQPDTLILNAPWGGNELGPGEDRPGIAVITLVSYKDASQIPADEEEAVVEKPLEANDISETFEEPGTMTWVADNNPTEFVEDFDNPVSGGINTSSKVGKYQRGTSDWANLQFELSYRMDLSTRNVFKIKVYIDDAATVPTVTMKLQDTKQGGNAWQTQTEIKFADQTKGEWIELTFDFSTVSTNTDYDKIVLQFGDEGANKGDGLFYFDDLVLQ